MTRKMNKTHTIMIAVLVAVVTYIALSSIAEPGWVWRIGG